MKIGLSLLAAAILLAAIALLHRGQIAPVAAVMLEEAAVAVPSPESAARTPAAAREPLSPQPAIATPSEPASVQMWVARVRVVDEDHQPVPDATITLWQFRAGSTKSSMVAPRGHALRQREMFLELRADAEGRAAATLDRESATALASKDGIGHSGGTFLSSKHAAEETELVLEKAIELRGLVLRADLTPAPGATVWPVVTGLSSAQRGETVQPESVTTDASGRFRLELQHGGVYGLCAELDGARTFRESISATCTELPELVLSFPGAYTLSGRVVDATGASVANADVSAWREWQLRERGSPLRDYERISTRSDSDGAFSVAVRACARYQLCATAPGHASSELVWLQPNATSPHPETRLMLRDLVEIRGRVVQSNGAALPGEIVSAEAETGDDTGNVAVPSRTDRFGSVERVTSDANGVFALRVHPGTTWTLSAGDDHRAHTVVTGVAPGCTDVAIVVSDADLAGCVVHGTVTRADGQAVGPIAMELVDYRDGKPRGSAPIKAAIDGARFTCPPVTLGSELGIQVWLLGGERGSARSSPLAPAFVGPFRADGPRVDLDVRLEAWGRLRVRVLDAGGNAARRVCVNAEGQRPMLGYFRGPSRVDADGLAVLDHYAPGAHRLFVFRDEEVLHEQDVTIAAGPNPELIVRLPAR